jgi:hypothetical protein
LTDIINKCKLAVRTCYIQISSIKAKAIIDNKGFDRILKSFKKESGSQLIVWISKSLLLRAAQLDGFTTPS